MNKNIELMNNNLSNKIKQNFEKEINDIYNKISDYFSEINDNFNQIKNQIYKIKNNDEDDDDGLDYFN